ncbi:MULTISPECIES: hypothetical protein [unclassified Streptomyces]|uniref:hypothetical protein n=1 Tax=unclassified Streptomyces TaxID=2593676 RepID=UPI002E7756BF|nr:MULTISPECIES: hypothetical protein [unclassified Streptomyces]MEE1761988.1 hypothetical protein [Streptomyces sp. SP18BB07]MEE1835482.1 hypothetical protein [Streptomyces sp. SP17KL33]
MRALVVRLCEALLRWAAPGPVPPEAEEAQEPAPPPPPPRTLDDIWPFESYDNLVRPYVLSPEELYACAMPGTEVPA